DPARASRLLAEATATATELGMHRLLTQRVQVPVLARDGDGWLVTDADRTVRLRDSKGLRYLADLLAHPGVERHVLDLVALTDGPGQRHGLGDAGPVLDPQAKAAYRARLAALRAELDDADAAGDVDGSARAQAELAALTAELSRAVGLGGRDRVVGSAAEKARLNVTRAVRTALARIAEDLPTLGARLDRDVRTGLHCVFVPD
ncbi:MAG: hypothetical protein JWN87_3118, partial [Frankiales bacterium]|nr:hypothetical protein [Frankiales bacterium]